MKKLLTLLLLVSTTAWAAPVSDVEKAPILPKNELSNPGAESLTAGWSATGVAVGTTGTLANVGAGKRAFSWDSNAAGQILSSPTVSATVGGRSGSNGVASCRLKANSGTATHTLQAYDGASVLASDTVTSSTSVYNRTSVNFVWPSSGTVRIRLVSVAANEPLIFLDDCYLGLADGFNLVGTAVTPATSALSWSGYHINTGGWDSTSATFADPNVGTGVSLVQLTNRNFGTVITEASGLPGITWPAGRAGRFWICATVNGLTSTTLDAGVQLLDGSNVIINPGSFHHNVGNTNRSTTLCGIQDVAAVGSATTKLRLASNGANTIQIVNTNVPAPGASIAWSITALDQSFPAPIFFGGVVSSSASVEAVNRVRLGPTTGGASCTSDPCLTFSSSNWVTGITWNSTGNYTVNFPATVYSAAPTCSVTSKPGAAADSCSIVDETTTSVNVFCFATTSGAATNMDFSMLCQGPK